MKTLPALKHVSSGIAARVALTIGLMSLAGCGSDAADRSSSMRHASPIAHDDFSQPARQDPPPTRPSTKEACDACQGLWAAHGIEPDETCICKTSDEGRACADGKDCQGECLLDGDAEFHVMEPGDPPRGYYQGHCAAYDTTFGCFGHIPDDVESQLPLSADEAGPFICVD